MKLIVEKEKLQKVLSRVQAIADKKSSMAILSTVLLKASEEGIELSATDLEIGLRTLVDAEVERPGELAVPARKFYEIVKDFPLSHILLEEENGWLKITATGDEEIFFRLACLPAEDFPSLPEVEDADLIELEGALLTEMISKTIFCVATEETRFILSGIYVEQPVEEKVLRFVATDGHRLALIDREVEKVEDLRLTPGVIIPRKAAQEMKKISQENAIVQFGLKDNQAILALPHLVLTARLIDGQYPDYRAVIPQERENPIRIHRKKLLEALKRISVLSVERYRPVTFNVSAGLLTLVSQHPDLGEGRERLPVIYEGDDFALNFNAKYLIDVLEVMDSEEVEFFMRNEDVPCIITGPEDQGFLGLIMPMTSI